MKLRLLLILSLLSAALSVAAQSGRYTITGLVVDSLTAQPLPYATVRALTPGATKPTAVTTTDTAGRFTLRLKQRGAWRVQVVSLGMRPEERTADLRGRDAAALDTIRLGEYSATLGTAVITAQRPLVKSEIDRISYSMQDDPEAQTNTLLDMLRKVPMVTVDGEDNIKVNGNSSFKVYVNGKPNQMMSANPSLILKNFPATVVKRVEVITDPGAKYDAEGVTGILNIVTESETKTSGYTLTPSVRINNFGGGGNFFGMVQKGRFTLSGYYGIGYNDNPDTHSTQRREVYADAVNNLFTVDETQHSKGTFQFGNLDASYEFSSHDLLSASVGLHAWNGDGDGTRQSLMRAATGTPTYSYRTRFTNESRYLGPNASADYQHTFAQEGRTLTLSYQYSTRPSKTTTRNVYEELVNPPFAMTDLYSDPDNHSDEHTVQADFTTPLGKLHTLSLGAKYIYRLNKSENAEYARPAGSGGDFALDADRSLDYRQRGDIAAAYAEYTLKVKDFTTRAGLRYEYSSVNVTYPRLYSAQAAAERRPFSTSFSDLVPSLSVGYNLAQGKTLKASYNLRIGRPGISYLSPYVSHISPEVQSYGNPNLDAEHAHNFALTFSSFTPKLNLNTTLSYTVQNDGFTSYSFLDGDGVQTTTYDNFKHAKQLKLDAYVNWNVTKKTAFNVNASGEYTDLKAYHYYGSTTASNHGFTGSIWGGVRQNLPWKLKLNLHGGGNFRSINLQGRGEGFHFYAVNLSRAFLSEDRLSLSLMCSNFFSRYRTFRSETLTETFHSESATRIDFLRFGIGLRYRLGSLKTQVKKASRSIENNDVVGGSSSGGSAGQDGGGM